jgi:N-formylglutamate amidohydrolase
MSEITFRLGDILDQQAHNNIATVFIGEDYGAVFEVDRPASQTMPFVFASPHSGINYIDSFVKASRLDPLALRRSEDSFVDDLYAEVPNCGAPLLKALFPRAFVDPNREAYELDPRMFDEPLPKFVNSNSPRVFAGLGTVPRVVTNGDEIYPGKISYKEAKHRIETCYFPYHAMLRNLIDETKQQFGKCILIDCHSMPSIGGPMDEDMGTQRVDVVLGNKHGASCAPELINFVENHLKELGLIVRRNHPYAGGYTTRHYGAPENGIHALQIEVNRIIYMDEETITRNDGFADLKSQITSFLNTLAAANFKF